MPIQLNDVSVMREGEDLEIGAAGQTTVDSDNISFHEATIAVIKLQSIIRGFRQRAQLPPGVGKWEVESAPHEQARSENNPLYRGKRTPVDDKRVSWSVTWEDYDPVEFTSNDVLENGRNQPTGGKWADPPEVKELRGELESRLTFENGGKIFFGDEGAPLNPRGRTGLRGRGLLGQWGPNHAADPIVTRREPLTGTIQVLAIKRRDTGEWALPGGMVKAGDTVSATVKKAINEVGTFKNPQQQQEFDSCVKELFAKGVDIYAGYVDDPRNTDNAWMESKAVHFHCNAELGEMLPLNLKKRDNSKGGQVGWLDTNPEQEPRYANMYASHMDFVEKIKESLMRDPSTALEGVTDIQMEGMDHHKSAFANYGTKDETIARKQSLALRCVTDPKEQPDGKLEAIDAKGNKILVDTYPVCGKDKDLSKYSCGLVVQIYFAFHKDALVLFSLLFVLQLYGWIENQSRNVLRNECRSDQENGFETSDRCGYAGLYPASAAVTNQIPFYLLPATGTCYEFSTLKESPASSFQWLQFINNATVSKYMTLDPKSELCDGVLFPGSRIVTYWLEFITVLLLLAFFIREFFVTKRRARKYDAKHLTTSDFSVMIQGLDREVDVDDADDGTPGLESKLWGDLERMGYKKQDIYRVEVARKCKKAITLMGDLARLRTERQELQADRVQTSAKVGPRYRRSSISNLTNVPAPSQSANSSARISSPSLLMSEKGGESKFGLSSQNLLGSSAQLMDKSGTAATEAAHKGASLLQRKAKLLEEQGKKIEALVQEKMQDKMEEMLQHKLHATEHLLHALVKAKDKSTGHAFITFNTEATRNDFLKRLRSPSLIQRFVFKAILRGSRLKEIQWSVGARVRHPTHGEGVIHEISDGKTTVRFDSGESHSYTAESLHKVTPLEESIADAYGEKLGLNKLARQARTFVYASRLRRKIVMDSCKIDPNDLSVEIAPEPSDIFWENLEISENARLLYSVSNNTILFLLVLGSALLLILVNFGSEVAKQDMVETEPESRTVIYYGKTVGLSVAASGITVITNAAISVVVMKLSRNAGPISQTGFQRSIFSMLSLFYLVNTSITPFMVGVLESFRTGHMKNEYVRFTADSTGSTNLVYQVWYDSGGVLNSMIFTFVTTMVSFAFIQTVPLFSFIKRYVIARRATSQQRLNALWLPPRMDVGKNYAKLFKAMSLIIIYAPLYPPFYLCAALYLIVSYIASRIGIAYWFARPPLMGEMVSQHMRGWLASTIGISLVMKRFIMDHSAADTPFYLSCIAWLFYMLVFEVFMKTIDDELSLESDVESAIKFSDTNKENYVCPKLHRGGTTRERRASLDHVSTRCPAPLASALGPGGPLERDQSGGGTSGPIAGARPHPHPCRSSSTTEV